MSYVGTKHRGTNRLRLPNWCNAQNLPWMIFGRHGRGGWLPASLFKYSHKQICDMDKIFLVSFGVGISSTIVVVHLFDTQNMFMLFWSIVGMACTIIGVTKD